MAESYPSDLESLQDSQLPGRSAGEEEAPPAGVRTAGIIRWALIALLGAAAVSAWIRYADVRSSSAKSTERYACPMHPSALQDRPGKCSICGMDLVPAARHLPAPESNEPAGTVARGATGNPGEAVPGMVPVKIAPERTQLVGMRTGRVTRQRLTHQLRTVGFVSADESSVAIVTTRFAGWVEKLRAGQVGQRVEKGQVLVTVSGPEVLTAQQVYLAASEWAAKQKGQPPPFGGAEDDNNALQRLGIARQDIEAVARRKRPLREVPIRAPVSGYVARRNVLPGLYVQPGTELFQIVDLSKVWIVADVYEQDAKRLRLGTRAQLFLAAYPGEALSGTVDFIYPALDLETHTLQARMQLANPELKLRPGMYGELAIEVPGEEVLTVPAGAVVDTGELQYVFLARPNGRFEPRIVRLGASAAGRAQVLEGLAEDDMVVTTANFLVDSESRLRAAAEAFGAPPGLDDKGDRAPKTAHAADGSRR